jgi:hypothetical protein
MGMGMGMGIGIGNGMGIGIDIGIGMGMQGGFLWSGRRGCEHIHPALTLAWACKGAYYFRNV